MIHIKTQNIPFESFSKIKDSKKITEFSKEEFSMAFEAIYEESSEVVEEDITDSSKDLDDVDVNEQGIPWFLGMYQEKEFANPVIKSDEGILLETIETEETTSIDSSINTLQIYPSDESVISLTEVEPTEVADPEKINTEITDNGETQNILSREKSTEKTIEVPLNTKGISNLEKSIGNSSPMSVQSLEEINNEFQWMNHESMIENSEGLVENVLEDFISAVDKNVSIEEQKSLSPQTQNNTTFELNEAINTSEIETLDIEGKEIPEESTDVVIQDKEVEVSVDETIQLEYKRGIEQLRSLRTIDPPVKAKETIVKVPESEWVNQVESFVVEQMDTPNDLEKVSTARIQLTPEHLGELEIELVLKDKGLTAKLVVEHKDTKEWLELKMSELTTKLAMQDIKVTDFQVSIASNEHHLADAGTQGNPFFKEQKQESKQRRTLNYSSKEEQVVEKTENKYDANTGRVSMWV